MKGKLFRILIIPVLLLILYPFQHELAGKWQDEWSTEIIYLPPAVVFEKARFGFEGILSDILWIRGFHYIEGQLELPPGNRFKQLPALYDAITNLDPYFIGAYHYGYLFLWGLAREPRAAESLLEKGIEHNPDEWILYYDLGVLNVLVFRDFAKAEKYLDKAIALPDCPPGVASTASYVKTHTTGKRAALSVWMGYLEDKSEQIRKLAAKRVLRLTREIAIEDLNTAIQQFHEKTGKQPGSLDDLIEAGIVQELPDDAEGGTYTIDPETHKARFVPPPEAEQQEPSHQ